MTTSLNTTRFSRNCLPHWEVCGASYFVTVRCADSLPRKAIARLQSLHGELQRHPSNSDAFSRLQRDYFRVVEKYADSGHGHSVLAQPSCAQALIRAFDAASQENAEVPHYVVMPNHWHAIIRARARVQIDLKIVVSRIKGRASKWIGDARGVRQSLWQREWFDRWIRSDHEWEKCVEYIRMNAVKAGLAATWQEYPWVK